MPRVSVVIPIYNRPELIKQTLESVLKQTYRDYEVIVVDDGSTDETPKVLSEFGDQIRVIRHDNNQGLSAARNTGILRAKGEFIAFIDSDDLWLVNQLELQMALFDANPGLMWAYSDGEYFENKTNRTICIRSKVTPTYDGDILESLFLDNFIGIGASVIKKKVFKEVGDFYNNDIVAEDWDMWLRIAAKYPVKYVAEPLIRYRSHSERKTEARSIEAQHDRIINTIKRALERNPKRLAFLENRSKSRFCIWTGSRFMRNGEHIKARAMYWQAICLTPSVPRTCLYWVASFLGRQMFKSLLLLWDRFKHN